MSVLELQWDQLLSGCFVSRGNQDTDGTFEYTVRGLPRKGFVPFKQ